jgi:phytoene dehydrogenase-like protein
MPIGNVPAKTAGAMKKLSRKQFLLAGSGALVGLAALRYAARNRDINVDYPVVESNAADLPKNGQSVTIIGGGLSGLMAGCELIDRGFDVTILEKNATLGGRLRSWRDKDFGNPGKGDWKGHSIEHGTHIVFPFYKNFREFLNRHGLSLRERTVNHPKPAISFAYPNGIIDDKTASKAIAPFHAEAALANMKYASDEDNRKLGHHQIMKLLSFDALNKEEVEYLDNISVKEWMNRVGSPDGMVKAFMDPLMDMANFLPAEETSALYLHRMIGSMFGAWQDMFGVQFFQDSNNDTIIQPMADHILAKGGKIVFNAEVEDFGILENRVDHVTTKPLRSGQHICPDMWRRYTMKCRNDASGAAMLEQTSWSVQVQNQAFIIPITFCWELIFPTPRNCC